MTIAELVVLLKFKADPSQLDAIGVKLDALTAKAKGLAQALSGVTVPAGGRGSSGGGGGNGPRGANASLPRPEQASSQVDMWRWQKAQDAKKQQAADKAAAEKRSAQHQQIQWFRRLTEVSAKVAVGLGAFNAGLLAVVDVARRSAVGLTNFGLETGLSPGVLQQFQAALAGRDVSPDATKDALAALSRQRVQAQLGLGDATPWQLLGVTPYQSVSEILKTISKPGSVANRLDPNLEKGLLEQLGIGGLAGALKRGDLAPDLAAVDQSLLLSDDGRARIMAMDREFQRMWNDLRNLGLQIGDLGSRYLGPLFKLIDSGVQSAEDFLVFLNGTSEGASEARVGVLGLAAAVAALTTALAGLAVVSAAGRLALIARALGGGSALAAGVGGVGLLGSVGLGVGAFAGGATLGSILGNLIWPERAGRILPHDADGNFAGSPTRVIHHSAITVNVDGGNPQAIVKTLNDWHGNLLRQATSSQPLYAPP